MTAKDFRLIAGAISDVEFLNEQTPDPAGIGAATLRLVVDAIAGRIASQHPRFNAGRFEMAALPIQSERRKRAIVAAVGVEPYRDGTSPYSRYEEDSMTDA